MSLPISIDPTNILILLRDIFKSDKKKSSEFEEYMKRLNRIQNQLEVERRDLARYEARLDVLKRTKKETDSEPPTDYVALTKIPEKERKIMLDLDANHAIFKFKLPLLIEDVEDQIKALRKSIKANEKSLSSNENFILSIFKALGNRVVNESAERVAEKQK